MYYKNKKSQNYLIYFVLSSFFSFSQLQANDVFNSEVEVDQLMVMLEQKNPQHDNAHVIFVNNTNKSDPIDVIFQEKSNHSDIRVVGKSHVSRVDHSYNNGSDSGDLNQYIGPILNSQAALVVDSKTGKVLYQKNPNSVRSIASISKLMTAMVVLDARLNMNEKIRITEEDIDYLKKSGSRLSVGTVLSREELLHIGLMSSENRAMHALARTYPGGMSVFLAKMNQKAKSLGMSQTVFYDPTGLDPRNKSTAKDLIKMADASYRYVSIRKYSTDLSSQIRSGTGKILTYKNSNALVRESRWNVGLQKTGYIREAGRCMIVRTHLNGRDVTMVFLGASNSSSRVNDAIKVESFVRQYPI